MSWVNWFPEFGSDQYLKATVESVFFQHQYYRLWSTLFVHADSAHLLSNLILFIPLIYLVSIYFGSYFLPVISIFFGGLTNAVVLQTLPEKVALVGISGVVNWLGAFWLVLFYLIDRRESRRRRFAICLFITLLLFVPDTYKPDVSYLSHLVGYALGLLTGVIYFLFNQIRFEKAEVFEEEEPSTEPLLPLDWNHSP